MAETNLRTKAWNQALSVNAGNIDCRILSEKITGSVPHHLRGGRILSNGPGWNQYDSGVIHPFDGHGYLRSFEFLEDGSVACRAKFIETKVFQKESQSNQFEIRGFATNPSKYFWKNIGFGQPRNVANTTIYRWKDILLAGWEGGSPHAIDAQTLNTIGLETFDGLIANKSTLAHMHQDLDPKRLVIANIKMGKDTNLTFHEIDINNKLLCSNEGIIQGPAFVHDFTITPNWYIVGGNSLSIDFWKAGKAFLGAGTLLNSVKANTAKTGKIVLVSRNRNGIQRQIQLPKPVFIVHFSNAFEQEDGTLIIDACIFHDFPFGEEFGYSGRDKPFNPNLSDERSPQSLYRITVPPNSTKGSWYKLTHLGVDFPRILREYTGRDAPFMVAATRANPKYSDPFDSVFYLDLHSPNAQHQIWTTKETTFVGEPIPIFDPITNTSHVVVMLVDGLKQESILSIFALPNISSGPICEIPLPFMPLAFHGEWDPIGIKIDE